MGWGLITPTFSSFHASSLQHCFELVTFRHFFFNWLKSRFLLFTILNCTTNNHILWFFAPVSWRSCSSLLQSLTQKLQVLSTALRTYWFADVHRIANKSTEGHNLAQLNSRRWLPTSVPILQQFAAYSPLSSPSTKCYKNKEHRRQQDSFSLPIIKRLLRPWFHTIWQSLPRRN